MILHRFRTMNFTISAVTPPDIPALLELIRELATFEKLENEVGATIESLKKSLCGPHAVAGALLAREGEQLAGYATYFFTFSSFVGRQGIWLDDVYVRPAFRKQGLGRKLLKTVAQIGAARNCGRYEWAALRWNKNALDLYAQMGAKTMDEWLLLRLDAKALNRLANA